jgi:hypothetical protein
LKKTIWKIGGSRVGKKWGRSFPKWSWSGMPECVWAAEMPIQKREDWQQKRRGNGWHRRKVRLPLEGRQGET